jgi:hypothetical protein
MGTETEWAKKWEQGWDEYVLEMTTDELQCEGESLASYFESCEQDGHGISTKDSIKARRIEKEILRRGKRPCWK